MFKTIVIATDGSDHGDRALALARSMATESAARLVIVHVTELVGGKGGMYPRAADEDEFKAGLEAQAEKLRAEGLNAEVVVQAIRLGGPAHTIAEIAHSVDGDLIVVGSRGRSLISEVILGSVPLRLLQIAHCPVLVVPRSGAEAGTQA